jgi:hypothetical protein
VFVVVPVDVAGADQSLELFRLQLLAGNLPFQLSDDLFHAARSPLWTRLDSGVLRQSDDSTSQQQAAISPAWLLPSFGLTACRALHSVACPQAVLRPDWVHEIKHDGYRLIVRRDGKAVRLFTRRGHDWTDRYPAIAAAAGKLRARSFTIDGEMARICDRYRLASARRGWRGGSSSSSTLG